MLSTSPRLGSLDQFRGYTVAGMCLVNFLAPFAVIHSVLKHNDTYFSYADTIMPGFLFIVGFAFRLTYLKRRRESGMLETAWKYARRSGKLLLLSLLIYAFVGDLPRWFDFRNMPPEFGTSSERRTASGENEKEELRTSAGQERQATGTRSPPSSHLSPLATYHSPLTQQAAIERLRAWRALGWQRQLLIHWRILAAKLIKSELWETLAIIGATQLVVLPWIGSPFWMRLVVMAALGGTHAVFAYWFNWDFLYGVDGNWMSKAWMTGDDRGWDGGIFGPINWGVVMLGGSLAYDLVMRSASLRRAIAKLAIWGLAFLTLGYSLSCLTRLYDLSGPELAEMRQRRSRQDAEQAKLNDLLMQNRAALKALKQSDAQSANSSDANRPAADYRQAEIERLEGAILVLEDHGRGYPDLSLAASPVLPSWERFRGRSLGELLAEPPFVSPPADDPSVDPPPWIEHRLRNYWMLGKRMPNLSFVTFATGFQFVLFAVFVAACDIGGLRLGLFRTFGTNPLAAYFIHGMMALVLALLVPPSASLGICLTGFAIAFAITYLLVRLLEKRGLFWRL